MTKRLKPLFKFYRRYEVDLWGKLTKKKYHFDKTRKFLNKIALEEKKEKRQLTYKQRKKMFKRFVYRLDMIEPQRKRRILTMRRKFFLYRRKLTKFYCNIKKHQFRNYSKKRLRFKKHHKNELIGADTLLSLLEHRLDIVLFRSNLPQSIFHARQLINHKKILVNNKVVNKCNYILKNFDIVSVKPELQKRLYKDLRFRLKRRKVVMAPPKYLMIRYALMKITIIRNPKAKEVPYPFSVENHLIPGLIKYY